METIDSKNHVPIRLTEERWLHMTEGHPELAGYYYEVLEAIADPEAIYEGDDGALIAKKKNTEDKYLVVIYRELNKPDGFVITAFLTSKVRAIEKRRKVWPV